MDRKTLLKNLFIGFLPLLVFILVEEIWGLTAGIIAAIVLGGAEIAYFYLTEQRLDLFVLFDVGLIVGLGLVSVGLQNDIFFKLKPGLIQCIMLILIGVTAFSDHPLMLKMSQRYMRGVQISDAQLQQMRLMMRRIFLVLLGHTVLVFYSALYMSNEAWVFISGGLLYVVLGGAMAFEFVRTWRHRREVMKAAASEEWFDLLTPEGKVIGRAPRSAVHGNPDLLHGVVHIHILNRNGEIFLQKRSPQKDLYGNYWDTAVGGHINSGESVEAAMRREAEEELGLNIGKYEPLFRYIMKNDHESELVHSFLVRDDGPFEFNPEEISSGRFWKFREIDANLGKQIFTPNFEEEYQMLKKIMAGPIKQPSRRERRKKR